MRQRRISATVDSIVNASSFQRYETMPGGTGSLAADEYPQLRQRPESAEQSRSTNWMSTSWTHRKLALVETAMRAVPLLHDRGCREQPTRRQQPIVVHSLVLQARHPRCADTQAPAVQCNSCCGQSIRGHPIAPRQTCRLVLGQRTLIQDRIRQRADPADLNLDPIAVTQEHGRLPSPPHASGCPGRNHITRL